MSDKDKNDSGKHQTGGGGTSDRGGDNSSNINENNSTTKAWEKGSKNPDTTLLGGIRTNDRAKPKDEK